MKVSVLIPYRPGNPERARLWAWVSRRYMLLLPDAEIVLRGDWENPQSVLPFNHPQAINRCADDATGSIYVIGDSDTAFNAASLRAAIEHVAYTDDWMVPQTYHQLTEAATEVLLTRPPASWIMEPVETEWTGHASSVAPIVVVSASAFHKVGGYDERYPGWGSDDRAFSIAMNTLHRPYRRWQGASYHLWHSRTNIAPDSNVGLTQRYIAAEGDRDAVLALREEHRVKR